MAHSAHWMLVNGRPAVRLSLLDPSSGRRLPRVLLADTGAGSAKANIDLLLDEDDCLLYTTDAGPFTRLSGAYSGQFRVYSMSIQIQELEFVASAQAVGGSDPPRGFDGIAGFRFLSRFTYGNFGASDQFGLETC